MMASNIKTGRNDLWSLLQDAQELFREATSLTGDRAEALRDKGLSVLEVALDKAQTMQTTAFETGRDMAATADDYVNENPWKAVMLSAGIGLVIGMLLARK
ncbi:MAG: DUF883 family protein [Burkholderiaceae bacterium]